MIQIYMNYIMKGDKNMKMKFFAAIMAMSICLVACGPLQEVGQDEVYTDLVCIPEAKMDELLIEKTGHSLQEMRDAGNDLQTVYLEEYDAYFGEAGDTNYLSVTCTSGTEREDGTVTLECESGMEDGGDYSIVHRCTVTLDRDTGRFISNVITDGYKTD